LKKTSTTTERKIYDAIINDEFSQRILAICKTAKSTEDIKKDLTRFIEAMPPVRPDVAETVGSRLDKLEEKKALLFKDGKWETSEEAARVLEKYFAL